MLINEFGALASTISFLTYNLTFFTMNCINELFSLDQSATFIIFFDLIKRCFERVKKTMKARQIKSVTRLYSFRVTFTLKLMVSFLGFCQKKREDFKLISEIAFPLVELLFSLLELFPHLRYYPLFIHYFKMLLDIQDRLNLRVPIANRVFALMDNRHFLSPAPVAKDIRGFDFEIKLRASQEALNSHFFWTEICREFSSLIVRETQTAIFRGNMRKN